MACSATAAYRLASLKPAIAPADPHQKASQCLWGAGGASGAVLARAYPVPKWWRRGKAGGRAFPPTEIGLTSWEQAANRPPRPWQCCSAEPDHGEDVDTGSDDQYLHERGNGGQNDSGEADTPAFGGLLKPEPEGESEGQRSSKGAHRALPKVEKGVAPLPGKKEKGGGKRKGWDFEKEGARLRAGLASEILLEIEEEVRGQQAAQALAARRMEWEDSLDAVLEPVLAIPGAPSAASLALALLTTMLLADAHAWRFIRRPLPFNFLLTPFLASAALATLLGFLALPLLRKLKAHQVIRREGPPAHYAKAGTPTMGGLYFVPAGVAVSCALDWGSNDVLVACAAVAVFGGIGLLDDVLKLVLDHSNGLPGRLKLAAQVAAGWALVTLLLIKEPVQYAAKASVQLAFGVLLVVGLHAPGQHWRQRQLTYVRDDLPATLLHLPAGGAPSGASAALWLPAQLYAGLATFCFAAMSNALNLTDGLDGLAAGTAAIAYTGMAIAVLPVSPALGRFGVAMAGSCCGFLVLNRHKAAVFMGDTGSLALGAGLAAMATAAGMFLPLLLIAAVFVAETISVIAQVSYFKWTRRRTGKGKRLFLMAPLHHHMELLGMEETEVVSRLYIIGFVCALAGACLGIASI